MQSLQPKAIFTSQGRVVLYRGEGLCNQQTKVAEEITNTEPKGRYSYFVCANQHPPTWDIKAGQTKHRIQHVPELKAVWQG